MDTRLVISPLRAFLLRLTITCAADWYVTHLRHAVLRGWFWIDRLHSVEKGVRPPIRS